MVDPHLGAQELETRSDLGSDDAASWSYWMAQESIADREEKRWRKKGREIVKRYRNDRPDNGTTSTPHRFNILWSNVQTLIPVLYGATPSADVIRRFNDQDDTARLAAEVLQRCIDYTIDMHDFDTVMRSVVEDKLLPGRGTARVMYIPRFGDPIADDENQEFEDTEAAPDVVDNTGDERLSPIQQQTDQLREVIGEEIVCTYVFWEDYREGPARNWREVPWLRYRAYMNRDELVERFGKKGKQVNLDFSPKGHAESVKDEPPADIYKKAVVHEYWDKLKKQVVWLAPGTPDLILDDQDDPLGLPDFYPSPDPLMATTTTDKRIPVPDYIEYQDQAIELDQLTARIDKLTRALKVSGIYPGEEKQVLQQLIDEGTENRLIPVEDWPGWTDKGGMDGLIQWMPIKQIAETLVQLYDARERTKQVIYETTGIGDIMRGNTSPDETATAQQLKATFSTRRIVPQQKAVGRFARDLFRLIGQCIALQFSGESISKISGYPQLDPVPPIPPQPQQMIPGPPAAPGAPAQPPAPGMPPGQPLAPQAPQMVPNPAFQQWQQAAQKSQAVMASNQQKQQQFMQAVQLIKDEVTTQFRVDIEADSTVAADEQADKQARIEFLQQMVPLLEQVVPIAQGNPSMAAVAREIALFAIRGFRVGRSLEETFEKAFDALGSMPPPPPKGGQAGSDSPQDLAVRSQQIKAQAQTSEQDNQTKLAIAQQQTASKNAQIAAQAQIEQMKLQHQQSHDYTSLALDAAKHQDDMSLKTLRGDLLEGRVGGNLS